MRGLFVKGTEGQIDCHFIHNIVAEQLGESSQVTDQPRSRLLKLVHAVPGFVHEAQVAVSPFRFRSYAAGKFQCPRVCTQNNNLEKTAPVPADTCERTAKEKTTR